MGWPAFRLDEVAEVAAGNPAPQEPSDFADDGSPFIRMQDVGRLHHTSNLTGSTDRVSAGAISRHRLRLFSAGSVLIPKSGASVNLNHRAMLGCDAYVVSHLAVIVPDRRKLLPEYLYLWSLSYDPRSQAQTTSLPSLPLSLIKAATIQVPPLPEQRRIVDLLSRAEGIVRLRREAEKKAAELIDVVERIRLIEILVPDLVTQASYANRVDQVRALQAQQSASTAKAQAAFDALLAGVFSG